MHAYAKTGKIYSAHTDAVGNVRAITDSLGGTGATYGYTVWGADAGTTNQAGFGDDMRARFKGALRMADDIELYYMRNRWYEPRSGRFLSEDPIGLASGINSYVFAGSDPVNGRDPMGLEPECDWNKTPPECDMDPWVVTADGGTLGSEEGLAGMLWSDFWRGMTAPGGGGWGPGGQSGPTCKGVAASDVGRAAAKAAWYGTISKSAEHGTWLFETKWRHATYTRSTPSHIYGIESTPTGAVAFIHGHLPPGRYPIGGGAFELIQSNSGSLSGGDMLWATGRGIDVGALEGGPNGGTLIWGSPKTGKQTSCKF